MQSLKRKGRGENVDNAQAKIDRDKRSNRTKSVDYLSLKQAREEIEPPENQLKKILGDQHEERKLSTHELRFQKSLDKLQVPEWYSSSEQFRSREDRPVFRTSRYSPSSRSTPTSPWLTRTSELRALVGIDYSNTELSTISSEWLSKSLLDTTPYQEAVINRSESSQKEKKQTRDEITFIDYSDDFDESLATSPESQISNTNYVKPVEQSQKAKIKSEWLTKEATDVAQTTFQHMKSVEHQTVVQEHSTQFDANVDQSKQECEPGTGQAHVSLVSAPKREASLRDKSKIPSSRPHFTPPPPPVVPPTPPKPAHLKLVTVPKESDLVPNETALILKETSVDFVIPKSFFEKFKDELEEARNARLNKRQQHGPPAVNGTSTSGIVQRQPPQFATAVTGPPPVAPIKDTASETKRIFHERPSSIVNSRQSDAWKLPENQLSVKIASINPKSEEQCIVPFIDRHFSHTSNRQSVLIEMFDHLSAFADEESNQVSESVSLPEVLNELFELAKITPNYEFYPQTDTNLLNVNKISSEFGIFTLDPTVMQICKNKPENAGFLLKKDVLWFQCNGCRKLKALSERNNVNYEACLYCYSYYCSHRCRDLERANHMSRCNYAKVSRICEKVLAKVRQKSESRRLICSVAQLGYETRGRGFVNFVIRGGVLSALGFIENGWKSFNTPAVEHLFYKTLIEYEKPNNATLASACRRYDPQKSFLLNVCIVVDVDILPNEASEQAKNKIQSKVTEDPMARPVAINTQFSAPTTNVQIAKQELQSTHRPLAARAVSNVSTAPDEDNSPKPVRFERSTSLPYRKRQKQSTIDARKVLKSVLRSLENIVPSRPSPTDPPVPPPRKLSAQLSSPTTPSFDRRNSFRHTVGISGRKYYRGSDGSFSPIDVSSRPTSNDNYAVTNQSTSNKRHLIETEL